MSELWSGLYSFYYSIISPQQEENALPDELMEEYKMLCGFEGTEIYRLRKKYYEYSNGQEHLTADEFLAIEWVEANPLKDRLRCIFGFDAADKIDFRTFLETVSAFNCTAFGRREMKIRIAFRMQDMDGDGVISKSDLVSYLERTTAMDLPAEDISAVADNVLRECSSDAKYDKITYADFQRVIGTTDFHTKLRLPI